jgi:hypothetical protein
MRKSKRSWYLKDAAQIAAAHPYTFYKPSAVAIALCRPGNFVQLIFAFKSPYPQGPEAERMWVRIARIKNGRFRGKLANDPVFIADLKRGDVVDFDSRHIIDKDFEDPVPDPTAPYQRRCFVTQRVLKGGARVGCLFRRPPELPNDSGWCILAGDESDAGLVDPKNGAYVTLGAVLQRDDSFRDLLQTPAPCAYTRDRESGGFVPTIAPPPISGESPPIR